MPTACPSRTAHSTLDSWKSLFEEAGLEDVVALDRSHLIQEWIREFKKAMGLLGQIGLLLKVTGRWGIEGYKALREVERIYRSPYTGYGIIIGRKPFN